MLGQSYAADAPLKGWDDPRLQRKTDETDIAFAERLTTVVNRATYHCDVASSAQGLAAWLAAGSLPEMDKYGYLHPGLLRCGFCHQRAFVLAETLRRGGVTDATTVGINGHVITALSNGGVKYMADGDYGVGPIAFPVSSEAAAPYYSAELIQPAWREAVLTAFKTTSDDNDYMTHEWLSEKAEAQWERANLIGLALTAAGAAMLIAAGILTLLHRRKKRGDNEAKDSA